jgi:hypothetical protein
MATTDDNETLRKCPTCGQAIRYINNTFRTDTGMVFPTIFKSLYEQGYEDGMSNKMREFVLEPFKQSCYDAGFRDAQNAHR